MVRRAAISLLVLCFAAGVFGQGSAAATSTESKIIRNNLSQAEMDRIIKKVAANEGDFRAALTNYVFTRDAIVSSVGMGGNITGVYHRQSFMTFNQDGSRFEKILFFPVPSLSDFTVTPEDLEDLGGVNPFALEPSMAPQYNFSYVGMEKIDELDLYVFDVTPKVIPDPKKSKLRMFTGRVWVDKDELMIVKSKGKAVPETKQNKFPIVETYRENIDGKYWFPTYAYANDTLFFDKGDALHIKMKVKYTDYRVGRSEVKILDDVPDAKPTPTPKKPE